MLTSRRGRAREADDLADDLGTALVSAETPSAAMPSYESPTAGLTVSVGRRSTWSAGVESTPTRRSLRRDDSDENLHALTLISSPSAVSANLLRRTFSGAIFERRGAEADEEAQGPHARDPSPRGTI